ncbi:ESX secretion-associated protein EspG [Actinokineospora pegani]|uniref:ESX secretion-associated protein EspG n=1 Tax=Actinokineospora pegani TaxID=2654637 RepID=UPI0012EAD890|nr:ESX secretion-associated protein EspG [Actinokineospora pegani]
MPPRSFSLSLAAVDVLSQLLGVNCRQYPLEVPSFGEFEEDRIRLARLVFTDLANRGLIHGTSLDADLEMALRVTSDNDVAVAMTGTMDSKTLRVRAAAAGSSAVLAVQEGQSVRFEVISPASLARSLVAMLPPLKAGPGQSVQVVQAAPVPARGQAEGFTQPVRAPRSSSAAQNRMAMAMLERPRTGFGFFMVTARGRHGRELDSGTVGWIDTTAGRYLVVSRPGGEGEQSVTYSPADSNRLIQQLDSVLGGG